MKFSVALCTYNGANYLAEQLDSIAAQTRPPDELVVCDDCSKDDTVTLLNKFASRAGFPVHVHVNSHNLGSTKNFEKAVALCTGALIALSDQDDVWMPEKLARQEAVFAERPEVGLVFTDATLVDKDLKPLAGRLWQYSGFGEKEQQQVLRGDAFSLLFKRNVITGATMAFRASFRDWILPIPNDIALIHDGWIGIVIAAAVPVAFIPEPLIAYRQHPTQQVGAIPSSTKKTLSDHVLPVSHYRNHLRQIETILQRMTGMAPALGAIEKEKRMAAMRGHIKHLQTRLNLPRQKLFRVGPVLREALAGRYHRHSNGARSIARDLLG